MDVIKNMENKLNCKIEFINTKEEDPAGKQEIYCKITIPCDKSPKDLVPLFTLAKPIEVILFIFCILLLGACLLGLSFHWWQYEQPWMGLIERIIKWLKYPF